MENKFEAYPTSTLEVNPMPFTFSPNFSLLKMEHHNKPENSILNTISKINNLNRKQEIIEQYINENINTIKLEDIFGFYHELSLDAHNIENLVEIEAFKSELNEEKIEKIKEKKNVERPQLKFRGPSLKEKEKLKPRPF